MRKLPLFVATSQLLTGLAGPARAEPPPSDPPFAAPDDRAAEELRAQGNKAAAEGRSKDALRLWREAWAMKPSAHLACNIGQTELYSVQRYAEARKWLTRCVSLRKDKINEDSAERRRKEEQDLGLTERHTAELLIETEPGASIELFPAKGAREQLGVAPLAEPVFVNPGVHRLEVRLGERSASAVFEAEAGREHRVSISLASPSAAPLLPRPPSTASARPKPFIWWPAALGGGLTAIGAALAVGFRIASDNAGATTSLLMEGVFETQPLGCGQPGYHPRCPDVIRSDHERKDFANASTGLVIAAGVVGASTLGYAVFESYRIRVSPSLGGITGRYVW